MGINFPGWVLKKWVLNFHWLQKWVLTRIEPTGAGGATGASLQLRRHQIDRGEGWRRSRHLRRVQRPRQGGQSEIESRSASYAALDPLFWVCFFWNYKWILAQTGPKNGLQKPAHTHKQTDRQTQSSRSWAAPGTCFGQLKRRYHSQKPPKRVPKAWPGILLTSLIRLTLRCWFFQHLSTFILNRAYISHLDLENEGWYCYRKLYRKLDRWIWITPFINRVSYSNTTNGCSTFWKKSDLDSKMLQLFSFSKKVDDFFIDRCSFSLRRQCHRLEVDS